MRYKLAWHKAAKEAAAALEQLELKVAALEKETLDSAAQEKTRLKNTFMEIERPLVANIVNSRKVMQVRVAIMTHGANRDVQIIEKHEFATRSALLDVMRRVDEATLSEANFRLDLAERMKKAINTTLENYEDFGGVDEVLFTEFIVQ